MEGQAKFPSDSSNLPFHVTRGAGPKGRRTISTIPYDLDQCIARKFPDALWVAAQQHSRRCYSVWILDLDYSYNECVAHLSLDDRWTLSPVRGPWHTLETDGKPRPTKRRSGKKRKWRRSQLRRT